MFGGLIKGLFASIQNWCSFQLHSGKGIFPAKEVTCANASTMEGKEALNIIDVDPQISVHDFDDHILGNKIYFHVIKLRESFHICVGTAAVMKNMAVAMQTKYVSTATTSTSRSDKYT